MIRPYIAVILIALFLLPCAALAEDIPYTSANEIPPVTAEEDARVRQEIAFWFGGAEVENPENSLERMTYQTSTSPKINCYSMNHFVLTRENQLLFMVSIHHAGKTIMLHPISAAAQNIAETDALSREEIRQRMEQAINRQINQTILNCPHRFLEQFFDDLNQASPSYTWLFMIDQAFSQDGYALPAGTVLRYEYDIARDWITCVTVYIP